MSLINVTFWCSDSAKYNRMSSGKLEITQTSYRLVRIKQIRIVNGLLHSHFRYMLVKTL